MTQNKGSGLSNIEIVTLAVYLLGGDSRHVDTEDVAVKANEIAPKRFSWRKYPDQINLEIIRVYLSDGKKPSKGGYLIGSGREGWLLTSKGLDFAKGRAPRLTVIGQSQAPRSPKERQWLQAERRRLLTSEAFELFSSDGIGAVSEQQASMFFRIDEYVRTTEREQKITRIVNAFRDDPQLGAAVQSIAEKMRRASESRQHD
jgi:hypothetical protein